MKYTLSECTCKPDEPYADGTLPKFFKTPIGAFVAYRKGKLQREPRYWGIHLNGLHFTTKRWR